MSQLIIDHKSQATMHCLMSLTNTGLWLKPYDTYLKLKPQN